MDATHLRLLAARGSITATFEPSLSPDQAEELAALLREPGSDEELALLLHAMADYWGLYLTIEW
jgi:hypothetical protein